MSEKILDSYQEIQDKLNNRQNFAIFWLLYAIGSILYGLSIINQYSTLGLLWFMMIHISSAYGVIITGIFCLFISKKIRNNEKYIIESLLMLLGITFFFYIGDCIQIGILGSVNLNDYLLEILNLGYFINIILVLITYRSVHKKSSLKELIKTRKKYFLFVLIGLIPAVLAQFIDYSSFYFLHPR
jgi:hypothetical protein